MKKDNVCKMCRREGEKLFLKGERCLSSKCALVRRSYAPGQHGSRQRRTSEYALQLREKQKAKRIYQVDEAQFKNYYKKAAKASGDTAELFLQFLERRLDNVVYRLGMASSRKHARQLVSHGHILVNGKRVNIPSYLVKPKDKIEVVEASYKPPKEIEVPSWLKLENSGKSGVCLHLPLKEETDTNIDFAQIIEFYSR